MNFDLSIYLSILDYYMHLYKMSNNFKYIIFELTTALIAPCYLSVTFSLIQTCFYSGYKKGYTFEFRNTVVKDEALKVI